jgi:hypothetical protein
LLSAGGSDGFGDGDNGGGCNGIVDGNRGVEKMNREQN